MRIYLFRNYCDLSFRENYIDLDIDLNIVNIDPDTCCFIQNKSRSFVKKVNLEI